MNALSPFRQAFVLLALLVSSGCLAQVRPPEVLSLRVGGVDAPFSLEADESGVVPDADAAAAYIKTIFGKGMRFSQCYFVLSSGYRRKLLSGATTTDAEDRLGLRSMVVVTEQPCGTASLRASRDASIEASNDKRALADHFRDVQRQSAKDGIQVIVPLKASPEHVARQIGTAGLISESDRHFTIGIGSEDGVVIITHVCAESRLVLFAQWTDQRNFPHCIERAKAFVDTLGSRTKAAR
jgi:hypothetical protein